MIVLSIPPTPIAGGDASPPPTPPPPPHPPPPPRIYAPAAGIIIAKLSDHLPYFVCIENKLAIQTVPKYIYIKDNNEATVQKFKTALNKENLFYKLNTHHTANPCDNYNIIHSTISEIQDICMPLKKVKYNKHCHKKSQWITQGIIKSINFRDKLYLSLKH